MSGRIFTLKNDCREACSVFFVSEMCCRQVSVPFFTVKILRRQVSGYFFDGNQPRRVFLASSRALTTRFQRSDVFNLELHFATLMRILLQCVTDVERTLCLNVARLGTLTEGNAIHDVATFVINEF